MGAEELLGQTGRANRGPSAAGALVGLEGQEGQEGQEGLEGLFQTHQLIRAESSQAAIQRALVAAAKARALAM